MHVTALRNKYIHGSTFCDEAIIQLTTENGKILLELLQNGVVKIVKFDKENNLISETVISLDSLLGSNRLEDRK